MDSGSDCRGCNLESSSFADESDNSEWSLERMLGMSNSDVDSKLYAGHDLNGARTKLGIAIF